jgi:hypothetical protein
MRFIKRWIKAFIIRTVVEDLRANGETRRIVVGEQFQSAAMFSSKPGEARVKGNVQVGNAFPPAKQ